MAEIDDMMSQVDKLIQSIESVPDRLERSFGYFAATTATSVEEANKNLVKSFQKSFKAIGKEGKKSAEESTKDQYKVYDDYFVRLQNRWKQTVKYFEENSPEAVSATRTANRVLGGQQGLMSGVQKLKSSLLSELPMGGLVGLALYGRFKQEDYAAAGRTVGIQFQRIGSIVDKNIGRFSGLARTLEENLIGTRAEIGAVASSLVDAGVTYDEAIQSPITSAKGFTNTLLGTSLAADKFFQVAAGTNARMMDQVMASTGKTAREAQEQILQLGFAARGTGQDFMRFTSSALQVSANLRMMRVDTKDVAEAQLLLQKSLEDIMPGASKQYIAAAAQSGMAQISQGLSGMSMGLSAVIGERMGRRVPGVTGGPVQGLEAYVAFREGFQAEPGTERDTVFKEMVNELGILAQEQGKTRSEQIVFLEQMGFGFEGARAVVEMREEVKKGTSVDEAFNKRREEFQNTAKTEAEKQSAYQRALVKAQHALQDIGSGILGLLVTGFASIIKFFQYALAWIAGSDEDKNALRKDLMKLSRQTDASLDQTMKGIGKLADVGVDIAKFTVKMPTGGGKSGDVEGKKGYDKTISDLESELENETDPVRRSILSGQIKRRKENREAEEAAARAASLSRREKLRASGGLGPIEYEGPPEPSDIEVKDKRKGKKKRTKATVILEDDDDSITRKPKPAPRGRPSN